MRLNAWMAMAGLATAALAAQADQTVEVYKSPYCGCCGEWVRYMKQNGFDVRAQDVADVSTVRTQFGMPQKLAPVHFDTLLVMKDGSYKVFSHH